MFIYLIQIAKISIYFISIQYNAENAGRRSAEAVAILMSLIGNRAFHNARSPRPNYVLT